MAPLPAMSQEELLCLSEHSVTVSQGCSCAQRARRWSQDAFVKLLAQESFLFILFILVMTLGK